MSEDKLGELGERGQLVRRKSSVHRLPSDHPIHTADEGREQREGSDGVIDISGQVWLPASLHPELAPDEYRAFMEKRLVDSVTVTETIAPVAPPTKIVRRKSRLSSQSSASTEITRRNARTRKSHSHHPNDHADQTPAESSAEQPVELPPEIIEHLVVEQPAVERPIIVEKRVAEPPVEHTITEQPVADVEVGTSAAAAAAVGKDKDKKSPWARLGLGKSPSKKDKEKEKEKEPVVRKTPSESSFFGLFSSRKRDASESTPPQQLPPPPVNAPPPPPTATALLLPDGTYESFYRLPIHVERAIYRLSHIKLANPKRPLYEQVLISNLMFWYLAVINKPAQSTVAPAPSPIPIPLPVSPPEESKKRPTIYKNHNEFEKSDRNDRRIHRNQEVAMRSPGYEQQIQNIINNPPTRQTTGFEMVDDPSSSHKFSQPQHQTSQPTPSSSSDPLATWPGRGNGRGRGFEVTSRNRQGQVQLPSTSNRPTHSHSSSYGNYAPQGNSYEPPVGASNGPTLEWELPPPVPLKPTITNSESSVSPADLESTSSESADSGQSSGSNGSGPTRSTSTELNGYPTEKSAPPLATPPSKLAKSFDNLKIKGDKYRRSQSEDGHGSYSAGTSNSNDGRRFGLQGFTSTPGAGFNMMNHSTPDLNSGGGHAVPVAPATGKMGFSIKSLKGSLGKRGV